MSELCHSCSRLIFHAMERARNEVDRRLDNGESIVSLFVEYENRKLELLKRDHDDEEYWFLTEAAGCCIRHLGVRYIFAEGWTRNYSNYWVKRSPVAPELQEG